MEKSVSSVQGLIEKLCVIHLGDQAIHSDVSTNIVQSSLKLISSLSSNHASSSQIDESSLIVKIKEKLQKQGQEEDAVKLIVLHRRLKQCEKLQNRSCLLHLLFRLSSSRAHDFSSTSCLFQRGLKASSTPIDPSKQGSSGFNNTSNVSEALTNSNFTNPTYHSLNSLHGNGVQLPSKIFPSKIHTSSLMSSDGLFRTHSHLNQTKEKMLKSSSVNSKMHGNSTVLETLSESKLIHQMLFVFQGIETKNIKLSKRERAFCIDNDLNVDKKHKQIAHRLCELGWLHNIIKKYFTARVKDKAFGLVGQAFCAALQQEVSEYYAFLSILQSQLHQSDSGLEAGDSTSPLTLYKLIVWTATPLERLKWVASLVENSPGKRGGSLVSIVHAYMQHGDDGIRTIIHRILKVVSLPIWHIIESWIYEGELHDPFQEFFVAADLAIGVDRLWFDKYHLRHPMIPSFIKSEEAVKIMLVGKTINFLRLVCHDRTALQIKKQVQTALPSHEMKSEDWNKESGFNIDLMNSVDLANDVTSSHLLHILYDRYKLLTHLQALRKFLLLGQGDFIRHLLDLLQEELDKPAKLLYRHNVSGPLEAAIRASNAQYEDPDVLARLDFRLLEINPGDCGWDVFSLDYHVDPPLNTLVTPDVMLVYLRIFIFLWRAKRVEYNLATIWTKSMEHTRKLAPLTSLQGVLHQCHTLASEMVHFVHQLQYYIAFEVLECSWAVFQKKLEEAKNFDSVIQAHKNFLDTLMKRCLLDQPSNHLLRQLRTIFDQIVKFEHMQKDIFKQSTDELHARNYYDKKVKEQAEKGVWGTDTEKENAELSRQRAFRKNIIPAMRARLKICATTYQDMVVQFLVQLSKETDTNLRNLSWRLDFNEHYRNGYKALRLIRPNNIKKYTVSR